MTGTVMGAGQAASQGICCRPLHDTRLHIHYWQYDTIPPLPSATLLLNVISLTHVEEKTWDEGRGCDVSSVRVVWCHAVLTSKIDHRGGRQGMPSTSKSHTS